ncbi:high frequency lysogenization protein HflD [Eionea flava]
MSIDDSPISDPNPRFSPWEERTLALSGMFQSALLVQQLATSGQLNQGDLKTAVHSLFEQNPKNISDVYGGTDKILAGLIQLRNTLKKVNTPHGNDIVRYVMGIVHLQKKLMKQTTMLNTIGQRIEQTQRQAELFEPTHDNVIANLADVYTSTISTFSFRIQVNGDYNYLQQSRVANQIRVLLFAGIRSAILWRQVGGSRLQVIFNRQKLITSADALIKSAKEQQLHH